MRTARFTVTGHFDGAPSATVEVVDTDKTTLVRVRPLRSREVAEMSLADVAHLVLEREAKHRALRALATKRKALHPQR